MALMALLVYPHLAQPVDVDRMLRVILVHDLSRPRRPGRRAQRLTAAI